MTVPPVTLDPPHALGTSHNVKSKSITEITCTTVCCASGASSDAAVGAPHTITVKSDIPVDGIDDFFMNKEGPIHANYDSSHSAVVDDGGIGVQRKRPRPSPSARGKNSSPGALSAGDRGCKRPHIGEEQSWQQGVLHRVQRDWPSLQANPLAPHKRK